MNHKINYPQLNSSSRAATLAITVLLLLALLALPASAAPADQGGTYTVQRGDTLNNIARANGTSVSTLINLNGPTYTSLYSNPNLIFPGWVLKLSSGATVSSSGETYTVQRGDYLSQIARNTGTSVSDLISLNASTYPSLRTNPNVIYTGWVLRLGSGASATADTTSTDTTETPSSTALGGGFELGGQTHSLAYPSEMKHAGMTWVKYQIKWSPGASADGEASRINSAHNQGFKVLFSVTGPDHPASIDYGSYADYVGRLAALGADGIEVWNEMNFDREWPPGEISGANYVNNMLRPAYNAIKGADAGTLVISGSPTPTGAFPYCGADLGWVIGCNDDTYVRQMAAAGAASVSDCVGMHYNAGTTSPFASSGSSTGSSHYSWYYPKMVDVYYGAFGGARDLCITELGYAVGPGLPEAFSWANGNTVEEQAQWLAENVSIASTSGKVRLLIVWNVDIGDSSGGDPQGAYSIIRSGGSCPACDALNAVTGGV